MATLLGRIGGMFRGTRGPSSGVSRKASYDIAKTTNENRRHWVNADSLSAVSQLTPAVRKTIRERARYEVQNNGYAAGLIRTLVVDTVGTGPRLQLLTEDDKFNENVENLWRLWANAVNWPLKTRILCGVKYVTGECFAAFRDSKTLEKRGYPVTLDLRLLEPDQVSDGWMGQLFTVTGDDGVICDEDGDVVAYRVLPHHPGDNRYVTGQSWEPIRVPVEDMIHWYQPERPGQLRGVSPLAPSLDIFAQLRRFTKATLTAAEIAAMLAGVLESDNSPMGDVPDDTEISTFDTIEMVRGMLVTLPAGKRAIQFKPEQPTTNYEMFVNAKLREAGRPLNVPFGKMSGDHSSYNYSSGRLDDAPYWHDRDVERQELEAKVFDPVLWRWLDFARFVIPQLAAYQGRWWDLPHCWHYDAKPTSDPVKDATGDDMNLTTGSDTLSAIASRDGTTVSALVKQRARDIQAFKDAGLPLPQWATGMKTAPAPQTQPQPATADTNPGPGGGPNSD